MLGENDIHSVVYDMLEGTYRQSAAGCCEAANYWLQRQGSSFDGTHTIHAGAGYGLDVLEASCAGAQSYWAFDLFPDQGELIHLVWQVSLQEVRDIVHNDPVTQKLYTEDWRELACQRILEHRQRLKEKGQSIRVEQADLWDPGLHARCPEQGDVVIANQVIHLLQGMYPQSLVAEMAHRMARLVRPNGIHVYSVFDLFALRKDATRDRQRWESAVFGSEYYRAAASCLEDLLSKDGKLLYDPSMLFPRHTGYAFSDHRFEYEHGDVRTLGFYEKRVTSEVPINVGLVSLLVPITIWLGRFTTAAAVMDYVQESLAHANAVVSEEEQLRPYHRWVYYLCFQNL